MTTRTNLKLDFGTGKRFREKAATFVRSSTNLTKEKYIYRS